MESLGKERSRTRVNKLSSSSSTCFVIGSWFSGVPTAVAFMRSSSLLDEECLESTENGKVITERVVSG